MERRSAQRQRRRLRVIFTDLATGDRRQGFTTNLSTSGLFLASAHTLPAGSRVRLEIEQDEHSVVLHGEVTRVTRVPPALRSVQREGMGINFIQVAALVSQLLPQPTRPAGAPTPRRLGAQMPPPATRLAPRASSMPKPQRSPRPVAAALPPVAAAAVPRGPPAATHQRTAAAAPPQKTAPIEPTWGRYEIELSDPAELRHRFDGELKYGGMFVPATERPDLDQTVTIELRLPRTERLRVTARVIHLSPEGHSGPPGFAVEFYNPRMIVETIQEELVVDEPGESTP